MCLDTLTYTIKIHITMALLKENEQISFYRVQSLIKENSYTETYRVVDYDNTPYFLKLFLVNKMPAKLINPETSHVYELEYCKQLEHRNLMSLIDSGRLDYESGNYQYYITNYFSGAILSDYVATNGVMSEDEALRIFRGILNGLKYLHEHCPALCHNDLDPSNIMLSPALEGEPVIIDYGHISPVCNGIVTFDTSDLNVLYHAKDSMIGIFDENGDVFSACCVLYFMLTGVAPWNVEITSTGEYKERFKQLWQHRNAHPLDLSDLPVSSKTKYILENGLKRKAADRLSSITEIFNILDSSEPDATESTPAPDKPSKQTEKPSNNSANQEHDINAIDIDIKRGSGKGFQDIAGMQDLKNYLHEKVIFVIKNAEVAQQYKLTPPNGLLLYGPPGCGKTYFAEKFAEETGFNFMLVKASDVGSSLVHGTQEKVKKLFDKAAKNGPIVLCFDEFDAIVPDRGARGNEYVASEVNEFLSQMNNCAQRGIFIVATSNRPDKIDPAVLRTGRIDKQVYVPLPDFEARKEMFKMYLNGRPLDGDIDYDQLAQATEGYIASDIAFIVNDAAMTAAFTRTLISYSLLCTAIANNKPSLRKEIVEEYSGIRDKMDGIARRVVVKSF